MAKFKQDKADALFSKWIKLRDGYACQRCGKKFQEGHAQGLDCSHFQSRRKENTRFEPLNADSICTGCHFWFHTNPQEHYRWQVKRKGQDVVNQIVLASNSYKKKDRVAETLYWTQALKDQTL